MRRISTEVKESEVMAVRKAACIAGAECVVITPLRYGIYQGGMVGLLKRKTAAEAARRVRLDVTSENSRSGGILSAIRRVADIGTIVLSSGPDIHSRYAA